VCVIDQFVGGRRGIVRHVGRNVSGGGGIDPRVLVPTLPPHSSEERVSPIRLGAVDPRAPLQHAGGGTVGGGELHITVVRADADEARDAAVENPARGRDDAAEREAVGRLDVDVAISVDRTVDFHRGTGREFERGL